jgi:hypothetical protein
MNERFTRMGFVRTFAVPALLLFAIPAAGYLFARIAVVAVAILTAAAAVAMAIFRRPDDRFAVEGVPLPRDGSP